MLYKTIMGAGFPIQVHAYSHQSCLLMLHHRATRLQVFIKLLLYILRITKDWSLICLLSGGYHP
jgi:hypothetical protein